jgi:hypothetical protein
MSMKNKFNKVLSGFSSEEKVFLYNFLYEDLSGKGVCGDTELAHVNKHEVAVLRSMGGAGTINENTKCVQFFGSPPPPPPVTTTSKQTAEIPEELKPYVQEVLSEAQDIYKTRKEEGYVPYTGQEIAGFTPEQERAFDLTSDVVGQTQAYAAPAAQLAGLAGLGTTDADISRFMNPYASQVIDVAERERRRAGDIEEQALASKAVTAGAFGGSRYGIAEAERRRNLEQGVADIRTAGLGEAFKQAVQQAQAQQESRLGASRSLTELAQVAPQGTADELARLEAVGAARRGQSQGELDISQRKFLEERTFPESALTQYSQFIQPTQNVLGAASTRTNTGPGQAQPTYLQQASGALGSAAKLVGSIYGATQGNSDRDKKTDIKKIGMDEATGLAMYSFRYKDDPKTYPKVVGPMADEVKEKYPELVSEVAGTEVVDFGGLASIAEMNKEENVTSLRQGGLVALQEGSLVGDTRFPDVPDPEEETTEQTDPYTEEELAALAEAQPGFFETVADKTGSGLSSIGDFFMERPGGNLLTGPTRLDRISDLLIGFSQADPSKPLGTQLGQAAASSSAKQAAERQQRLANILAKRLLGIKATAAGRKLAKEEDISTSTLNTLSNQLNDLITKGLTDREKEAVIGNIENFLAGSVGPNARQVRRGLEKLLPRGGGKSEAGLRPASKPNIVNFPPAPVKPTRSGSG